MSGHDGVPVRSAATVILVRDAPELEVLMLRRRDESLFAAGAYVFPGGALDASDHAPARRPGPPLGVAGREDADACERLGVDAGGLAYWMAAVRECFEEAGLLVAGTPEGTVADPAVVEQLGVHRPEVEAGRLDFTAMVRDAGLQLTLDEVCYFAHWITPVGPPRRYDTRFFVAAAPVGQEASPDGEETVEAVWMTPAHALGAHDDGAFDLIFPTLRSLAVLARFDTAADVMAAARAFDRDPSPDGLVNDHSGARIRLPGDPADRARAEAVSPAGGARA